VIRIDRFSGARPALSPRTLPAANAAAWCSNADVRSGQLRGVRAPAPVQELVGGPYAKAARIKNRDTGQVLWVGLASAYAEVVASPVLNDAFNRVYYFAPHEPPAVSTFATLLAGGGFSPLAVPYPATPPTLAVEGTATSDSIFLRETRAYLITYLTEWGEESAPSEAVTVELQPGQAVRLSGLDASSTATVAGRDWAAVRIYRTVVGNSTVEFYEVDQVVWGADEYLDELPSSAVVFNRVFASANDNLPEGFWGVRHHSSGSLVAFKGNTVRFSVPYLPHAWPDEWQWGFPDDIVAIEPYGQSLVVLTESGLHLMFGPRAPELGITAFPHPLPCLGYGTVVNTPRGVFFMTEDGLAVTSGGPPEVFTSNLIERDQWRRAFAKDAWAVYDDGYYTAVFLDGTGFRVDLTQGTGLGGLELGTGVLLYTDRYTGATFAVSDTTVYEVDPAAGPPLAYTWESGDFYLATPANMEALEVDFDELPPDLVGEPLHNKVKVTVWADGQMRLEQWVARKELVTLPKGFKATVYRVEVYGACPIHHVLLSPTAKGLNRG
jgi:hypothetical protein